MRSAAKEKLVIMAILIFGLGSPLAMVVRENHRLRDALIRCESRPGKQLFNEYTESYQGPDGMVRFSYTTTMPCDSIYADGRGTRYAVGVQVDYSEPAYKTSKSPTDSAWCALYGVKRATDLESQQIVQRMARSIYARDYEGKR